MAIQADVAKKKDIERLFAETKKAFGRLDILVNNAGVYQFAPLEEVTENEFQREFNTNVLANELGPRKVRVNSINPGGVETEGLHAMGIPGSDFEKQMIAQTPLGRIGQPHDIAPAVAFLASPESAWISGEMITVSSGLR